MKSFNRAGMIRFLILAGLLSVAIGANAALMLRQEVDTRAVAGETRAEIGGAPILLPRAYLREPSQWAGGRLERLDIAMRADDLTALAPQQPAAALVPEPERVTLHISAANAKSGPAERFQLLHSRFVAAETRNGPAGLVTRGFRAGTPYEDREIHIGAGIGRHFYALCPKGQVQAIEPCTAIILAGPHAVEIRFMATRLPEWKRLGTDIARIVDQWRAAALPPAAPGG